MTKITILSGGVGGARLARALDQWNYRSDNDLELTAIVNVGDDFTHLGLRVAPDIDSITYHLADLGDRARGWGREGDSDRTMGEILQILPEVGWFQLGDLDIAHNLMRTHLLGLGLTLSEATKYLNDRYGVRCRVLPVTNDPSPTRVVFSDPEQGRREVAFQEWWVRDRAEPLPNGFEYPDAAQALPTPGVLEAISEADVLVIAPSNPVVSIQPILAILGVREAVRNTPAPVVGISPIIGGRPVRGWADRCLSVLGIPCTATAVAEYYGYRAAGGLLDGWLMDPSDRQLATSFGGSITDTPLIFSLTESDDEIIDALLALAGSISGSVHSGLSV